MGHQLGDLGTGIVLLLMGSLECVLGLAALRWHALVLALGVSFYGVMTLSVALSWSHLPAWVERSLAARAEERGLPVREDMLEFMALLLPIGMLVAGLLMGAWAVLVGLRIRRSELP